MFIPFPSFTISPPNSCPGITGGSTYRALFSSPMENVYTHYIYIIIIIYITKLNKTTKRYFLFVKK